jgi:integrase
MSTPSIAIFVRHSADCKYTGDEFCRRCRCRKHFRWTQNGVQYRRKAGTRSWEEAEEGRRRLEDELTGRIPVTPENNGARSLQDAVDLFLKDKKVQGVSSDVQGKYTRELARLRTFCESQGVHTVQRINRETLTEFCATWADHYPSTITRAKVRERLRGFLKYCYEAQWLTRIPQVPKVQIDEPETQPLTADEYKRLLAAVPEAVKPTDARLSKLGNLRKWVDTNYAPDVTPARVHAFIQCMRWTGLAITDALKLRRKDLEHDKAKGIYRVVTQRQKMKRKGTGHVSVPIPNDVAQELLTGLNGNPEFIFWSGNGSPDSATKNWAKRYIAKCFAVAKIECNGYMKSHRLRDTFAVDLLEKGVPMEEVSKLLGHSSIKTTEKHYAKWSKGRQDRLDTLVIGTAKH